MRRPWVRNVFFLILPLLLGAVAWIVGHRMPDRWWTEVLGVAMPLVLGGILLLLVLSIVRPPPLLFRLPVLLAFVIALGPLGDAWSLRLPRPATGHDLSVMSFNVAHFNPLRARTLAGDPQRLGAFHAMLRTRPTPDVLCIQELFHSHSTAERTVDSILAIGGYDHHMFTPFDEPHYHGLIGVATFSKLPIVDGGPLAIGAPGARNGQWVDVAYGTDTLRILNLQLKSMSIRWRKLAPTFRENLLLNYLNLYQRLRMGHAARAREMDVIARALNGSPHPVIVCADLNAPPWSAAYQRLTRRCTNAHTAAGSGPGITYHHFPWFIRIDHQCADRRLHIAWSRTLSGSRISDHHPIEAGFVLRDRR